MVWYAMLCHPIYYGTFYICQHRINQKLNKALFYASILPQELKGQRCWDNQSTKGGTQDQRSYSNESSSPKVGKYFDRRPVLSKNLFCASNT